MKRLVVAVCVSGMLLCMPALGDQMPQDDVVGVGSVGSSGGFGALDELVGPNGLTLGDANADGIVNLKDYMVLETNFGMATNATWSQADFNFDGAVDMLDYMILEVRYGNVGPAGAPRITPTPGAIVLGGIGLVLVGLMKRRAA